jgi:transposase-like protein
LNGKESRMGKGQGRSPEERIATVRRLERGESMAALRRELGVGKNTLYRWAEQYRKEGEAGLRRKPGRPLGGSSRAQVSAESAEEKLRRQVVELERTIGRQAVQLDFFKRAFKRVKESSRTSGDAGATASTGRSGQ